MQPQVLQFAPLWQGRGAFLGVFTAGQKMTDARQPTADYYREKADEIRRLASGASSAEIRLELLEIAALFERLAHRVERRNGAAAK